MADRDNAPGGLVVPGDSPSSDSTVLPATIVSAFEPHMSKTPRYGTATSAYGPPEWRAYPWLSSRIVTVVVATGIVLMIAATIVVGIVVMPIVDASKPSEDLDTVVPAGWMEISVVGGTGTISIDPTWLEVSESADGAQLERRARAVNDDDIVLHGVWEARDTASDHGVRLTVWSTSVAADRFLSNYAARSASHAMAIGANYDTVDTERYFNTTSGERGFLIERKSTSSSGPARTAVASLFVGKGQLTIFMEEFRQVGHGIETLETVLNSLVILPAA